MTTNPPANSWVLANFQSTFSLDKSVKKHIKREASPFTELEDVKFWDTWHRNILATTRAQCADEELNNGYKTATYDEMAFFKKNQKFTRAGFDKVL